MGTIVVAMRAAFIRRVARSRSFLPPAYNVSGRCGCRQMGFITDKYEEWKTGSSDKQFQKTVEQLAQFENYDLNAFLETLEDGIKFAGVKGLKTKLPGMSGNPMTKEIEKFIRIINAMTPKQRSNPNSIKTPDKKNLA